MESKKRGPAGGAKKVGSSKKQRRNDGKDSSGAYGDRMALPIPDDEGSEEDEAITYLRYVR